MLGIGAGGVRGGAGGIWTYNPRAFINEVLSKTLAERPRFEYLASDSESFARYLEVRANRNDPFYRVPAGGVDLCSVQVPIRRAAEE